MSTDAMYNSQSRFLHQKLKVYFSPGQDPVEITRDNYLISSTLFEESGKISDSPFGDVTSNELSCVLLNENGIFNPINTQGPYYGKIRRGLRIEAFIRPDEEEEWDPQGVFYVTDWLTATTGLHADFTAYDALYNVIHGPIPSLPVYKDIPFNEFAEIFFGFFGYTVKTDITTILPYVYTSGYSSNKVFLTDLMKSIVAECFCNHSGEICIISKIATRDTRAKFTDDDQIISIDIKQSITTNYDSVSVEYHQCRELENQKILDVPTVDLKTGMNETSKFTFNSQPVLAVTSVKNTGTELARVITFQASSKDFAAEIQSIADTETSLIVGGTLLDSIKISTGEELEEPLRISSTFIQNENTAQTIKDYCSAYIASNSPSLNLVVRGNPKLQLGDKIEVHSIKYKTDYVGILSNAQYDYEGSLSCKMTLINASFLRGDVV